MENVRCLLFVVLNGIALAVQMDIILMNVSFVKIERKHLNVNIKIKTRRAWCDEGEGA